jgi:hypothetical protein
MLSKPLQKLTGGRLKLTDPIFLTWHLSVPRRNMALVGSSPIEPRRPRHCFQWYGMGLKIPPHNSNHKIYCTVAVIPTSFRNFP